MGSRKPELREPSRRPLRLLMIAGLWLGMSSIGAVAHGQALHTEQIGETQLIVVSEPFSDATAAAWPELIEDQGVQMKTIVSGTLTLASDLETAFAGSESAPAVVTIVGAEQVRDLRALIARLIGGLPAVSVPARTVEDIVEGGLERRLGTPGSQATISLVLALPRPADWRRASIEVLVELLPELLAPEFGNVLGRIKGDRFVLELRVEPESADLTLRRLRLFLARISADSGLERDQIEEARLRVAVRRQAAVEDVSNAASKLGELWLGGGLEAIRQYLFGVAGVSFESVQTAVKQWLPQHPGAATLTLPPRVFNPRFAAPPQTVQLANDVPVTLLHRPGAPMAGLCLRPVLVPDVDGDLTATVLTRMAAELRSFHHPPGWIRVHNRPPQIEIAGPPDDFAGLCEALQSALGAIADDERPIDSPGGSARRRALRLMASRLGLDDGLGTSPARLLRADNIVLGAVTIDAETALESFRKFGVGGQPIGGEMFAETIMSSQKTRTAAPGDRSVVIIAFPLPVDRSEGVKEILAQALGMRSRLQFSEFETEVLRPLVPGREVALILVEGTVPLDELDEIIAERYPKLVAPCTEGELQRFQKQVASAQAVGRSGVLGRARTCAAIAAGERGWSTAQENEMKTLSVTLEEINTILETFESFEELETTGAGKLPIVTEGVEKE